MPYLGGMKVNDCLFPKCKNSIHSRGLCSAHYHTASRQVANGMTTWEKLERSGKVKVAAKRGRKPKVRNHFLGK
jgi:hypothetical protein